MVGGNYPGAPGIYAWTQGGVAYPIAAAMVKKEQKHLVVAVRGTSTATDWQTSESAARAAAAPAAPRPRLRACRLGPPPPCQLKKDSAGSQHSRPSFAPLTPPRPVLPAHPLYLPGRGLRGQHVRRHRAPGLRQRVRQALARRAGAAQGAGCGRDRQEDRAGVHHLLGPLARRQPGAAAGLRGARRGAGHAARHDTASGDGAGWRCLTPQGFVDRRLSAEARAAPCLSLLLLPPRPSATSRPTRRAPSRSASSPSAAPHVRAVWGGGCTARLAAAAAPAA
jgi:hypothetical protein